MTKLTLAFLVLASGTTAQAQVNAAASPARIAANTALADSLNWDDGQDFDFAARGFLGTRKDPLIRDAAGTVVRDLGEEAQFTGPAPATVNPSLWRNATLLAKHGLFRVADGIWQVRGFDLSNMTVIRGKTGWIIVDPLTTTEAAQAALALVTEKLGRRPVTGVIYTHSHVDHFGGALGVVAQADAKSGKVPVIAPEGFVDHAVSENVIAGPAMLRRATYMFGAVLPRGATGHVSAGLGPARTAGSFVLVPPNDSIRATGDKRTIDGVEIEFQLTPNTEAPAEMNFYLPQFRALCLSENGNGAMHNLLTPRGALVRDAKGWAAYLLEARRRWGGQSDLVFTSHFWPRWGGAVVDDYILRHAQAYAFVHNESVRLMNQGLNAVEIGEAIRLPAPLGRAWFNRPNYGSLKFNARAVYQRYLGAFDGDPVNLDPLPRAEAATRYVAAMGGGARVLALAAEAAGKGDDRWAATLLGHLVRAEPDNRAAKDALARSYDQLAWAAEAAPWRNFYLTGSQELRGGIKPTTVTTSAAGIAGSLRVADLLDTMSVRVVPDRALAPMTIAFVIPDARERHLVTIGNGVMLHESGVDDAADAILTIARADLIALIGGQAKAGDLLQAGKLDVGGDLAAVQRLMTLFQPPKVDFPLVTP